VDGRRVINDWAGHWSRRDIWDVELEGGKHELRFEHFREGRGNYLWVRMCPVSMVAADSQPLPAVDGQSASMLGAAAWKEPKNPCEIVNQADLLASLGKYQRAGQEYADALEMAPFEAFWLQQSALLGLLSGNKKVYLRQREIIVKQQPAGDDAIASSRAAVVALVGDAAARGNEQELRVLLGKADPAKSRDCDRAQCQLAQGIAAYRAGRYADAVEQLTQASNGRLTAEGKITAGLFKAMTLRHLGETRDALAEYWRLQDAFAALPPARQMELDPTELQDRLVCQIALGEAKKLINGSPPTAAPATQR
jgi:tetratricopeptide (TPR) repeat protein